MSADSAGNSPSSMASTLLVDGGEEVDGSGSAVDDGVAGVFFLFAGFFVRVLATTPNWSSVRLVVATVPLGDLRGAMMFYFETKYFCSWEN